MKLVSIIIPHYNGKELLYNCINSIYQNIQIENFEIIIVDNGSTDDSVQNIEQLFSDIVIITNETNVGYSGGCNIGAQNAKGKYLLFLNNDTEHSKEWVEKLVNFLDSHPDTFAVQPKILNIKNKEYFDYAGGAGGFLDHFGFPYVKGRIFNTLEKDTGQYDEPSEIFWSSGAAMMVRADIFNQLNGFDEVYFAYMEEIDLCWRMHNYGFKTMSIGSSKVKHIGGATLAPSPQKVFLNHRNSLCMLTKNLPRKVLYRRLFVRLCWDGFAGVYYFLRFNFLCNPL